MQLSLACNWQDDLLEALDGTAVTTLYGRRASDPIGGGRPSAFVLGRWGRRSHAEFIRRVRRRGLSFNYLLNTACLDNLEMSRQGQRAIRATLDWVAESGADRVTVSLPLLARVVRQHYPQLRIAAGMFANIDTLQTALRWEDLGADLLTLPGPTVNRDLPLLRQLAERCQAEVQLIANNACMLGCHMRHHHAAAISHASQSRHWSGGFYVDHCAIACKLAKLRDPAEILKADWIRPEDLPIYEALGVRHFKLVDRTFPTAALVRIARAYSARRHDGNLLELFPSMARTVADERARTSVVASTARVLGTYLKPRHANPLGLRGLKGLFGALDLRVDNRRLDGFLDGLPAAGCPSTDCRACGHCRSWAKKVVEVDPEAREAAVRRFEDVLRKIDSGDLLAYSLPGRAGSGGHGDGSGGRDDERDADR